MLFQHCYSLFISFSHSLTLSVPFLSPLARSATIEFPLPISRRARSLHHSIVLNYPPNFIGAVLSDSDQWTLRRLFGLLPLLCLSGTRTPLARSILHLQLHSTSSTSWPVFHQPSFRVRVIHSICFHHLSVSSMSPSDRHRRFQLQELAALQALPGSSASMTPLLVFGIPI